MTFTCPHFAPDHEWCLLLDDDCVPGRPGCVCRRRAVFLVPVDERIRLARAARRPRADRSKTSHPVPADEPPAGRDGFTSL